MVGGILNVPTSKSESLELKEDKKNKTWVEFVGFHYIFLSTHSII